VHHKKGGTHEIGTESDIDSNENPTIIAKQPGEEEFVKRIRFPMVSSGHTLSTPYFYAVIFSGLISSWAFRLPTDSIWVTHPHSSADAD
jgi:hypothetical protein